MKDNVRKIDNNKLQSTLEKRKDHAEKIIEAIDQTKLVPISQEEDDDLL